MARLYANENFPFPVVEELRLLGHEVVTIQETGMAGQAMPDRDVLVFAKSQQLTLLTLNRKHFIRLHGEQSDHAGIIACTFDRDFIAQAARIDEAIRRESPLAGKIIRVNRPSR
jgi:hypothetical protein